MTNILEKYKPFPEFAWKHRIIRDTIHVGDTSFKAVVARCDDYSPYATWEPAVWLLDIQKILKEHIENFPKSEFVTMGNSSTAISTTYPHEDVQNWVRDLEILVGLKEIVKVNERREQK